MRQKSTFNNDPISDMLTRIRNAQILHQRTVQIPWTRMTEQILAVFEREGFICGTERLDEQTLQVTLKYEPLTQKSCITNLKRLSKPGLRLYANSKEIPEVLGGMGVLVLSTSQGIITDRDAKARKIGGELVCSIW